VSVVHALLSLHTIGVAWHPFTGSQLSVVHALLSLQTIGAFAQPLIGSQLSVVHALLSSQFSGGPGTQPLTRFDSAENDTWALLVLQFRVPGASQLSATTTVPWSGRGSGSVGRGTYEFEMNVTDPAPLPVLGPITHHVPGLWWAVAAAIGFGVAGFLLGFLSQEAGWIAGVWGSRVAMLAFYAPMAVVLRRDLRRFHVGAGLEIALLAGAADLLGVVSFAAGAEQGYVSIVLAASAVFPLIAVALSVATFHERLVPNQYVGIALVVGGLLLLGLG